MLRKTFIWHRQFGVWSAAESSVVAASWPRLTWKETASMTVTGRHAADDGLANLSLVHAFTKNYESYHTIRWKRVDSGSELSRTIIRSQNLSNETRQGEFARKGERDRCWLSPQRGFDHQRPGEHHFDTDTILYNMCQMNVFINAFWATHY